MNSAIFYGFMGNILSCPCSARGGGAFLFQGGGQAEHHRQTQSKKLSHPYHAEGRGNYLSRGCVAVRRVLRAALPVVHGGADGDMRGELRG